MSPIQFYCTLLFALMVACFMTAFTSGAPDNTRARLLVASIACCAALISALLVRFVLP